jgi:hypothetical protein
MGSSARTQDLHELTAIWRKLGLTVVGYENWPSEGYDGNTFEVFGVHHTAATSDIDRMLVDGRPSVPGPLCNIATHRDGDIVLIASGKANHFGVATWTNSRSLGMEVTGPIPLSESGSDAFPNYRAAVKAAAGFCIWKGKDPWTVIRGDVSPRVYLVAFHKEVAVPFGRKIDMAVDATRFRNDVRAVYKNGLQEDDMTPEQEAKLNDTAASVKRIENVLFNGHVRQDNPIDNLYGNADNLHDAWVVQGTTSAEETVKKLFVRVREISYRVGNESSDNVEDLYERLDRLQAELLAAIAPPSTEQTQEVGPA